MAEILNQIYDYLEKANLPNTANKLKKEIATTTHPKHNAPELKIRKGVSKESQNIFQNFMNKIASKPTMGASGSTFGKAFDPSKLKKIAYNMDFMDDISEASLFNKPEIPRKEANKPQRIQDSPIIGGGRKNQSINEVKNSFHDDSFSKKPFNKKSDKNEDPVNQMTDKMQNIGHVPSIIHGDQNESSFLKDNSFVFPSENKKENVDEYIDDEDAGFDIYEVDEKHFEANCKELADKFNFPARSFFPESKPEKKKHSHKRYYLT